MTADAIKVLAFLRDNTRAWVPMPTLRVAAGYGPAGFGEPKVGRALTEIRLAGIKIEQAVAWVHFPGGDALRPKVSSYSPGDALMDKTMRNAGFERENVWRLP